MDGKRDLAPDADVDEQRQPVRAGEAEPADTPVPLDADPADAAEQAAPVPVDDEDDYRPGS
ncbi:hypothetical protein [Prauserella muralis]|uniref:Uncharacterized protein n=1 Tax=Prauserella muralis TaxID=588067 RepID=A0A2V4B0B1_9PSEU|nr:hypothetical protein [Prauserella muralis]PXY27562.1 hypothetical protein BAY60_14205 [Prauserella muralis]TWE22715.1 hypothetical protein FHX69_3966 [Prauserella muralis]